MHLIVIDKKKWRRATKNDEVLNDGGRQFNDGSRQFNDGASHLTMAQDIWTMAGAIVKQAMEIPEMLRKYYYLTVNRCHS